MSRADGNDMIRELLRLNGTDTVVKTASEKEDKKEEKKEDKKEEKCCEKCGKEKCECKEDKKEDKKEEKKEDKKEDKKDKKSKKKKAEVMLGVINELVKLANDSDASGADEAASLVDDALQIIMKNVEKE